MWLAECALKGGDAYLAFHSFRASPFGFQAFYPGPGLGGHCIPIDPFYLSWVARKHGMPTRFIELTGEVNASMPDYVVEKVALALNGESKPIKGSKICILGVAYKRDVDDPHESPSFELMELLAARGGAIVNCCVLRNFLSGGFLQNSVFEGTSFDDECDLFVAV